MLVVCLLITEFALRSRIGGGLFVRAFQISASTFVDTTKALTNNNGGAVHGQNRKRFGVFLPSNGQPPRAFTKLQVTQQKETNNPNLGLSSSSEGDYAAGNLFYDEEGGYYYDADGYYDEDGNYYYFDDGDAQEYYYDPKTGEKLAVYYDDNGYAYDKNGYITADVETFYDNDQGAETTAGSQSNGYSINGSSSSFSSNHRRSNERQIWPGIGTDVEKPPLNKRLAIGVALLSVAFGLGVNLSGDLIQSLEDSLSQSFDASSTQSRNERIVQGSNNGDQLLNGARKEDTDQLRTIMKGLGGEAKHLREGADNTVLRVVDNFVSQDGISSIVDKIEAQGEGALKQLEKLFEMMGGTSKYGADGGGIFGPNGLFSKDEMSHLKDSVEAHGDKLRGHVENFIQGLGNVNPSIFEVDSTKTVTPEPPQAAVAPKIKTTDRSESTTLSSPKDGGTGSTAKTEGPVSLPGTSSPVATGAEKVVNGIDAAATKESAKAEKIVENVVVEKTPSAPPSSIKQEAKLSDTTTEISKEGVQPPKTVEKKVEVSLSATSQTDTTPASEKASTPPPKSEEKPSPTKTAATLESALKSEEAVSVVSKGDAPLSKPVNEIASASSSQETSTSKSENVSLPTKKEDKPLPPKAGTTESAVKPEMTASTGSKEDTALANTESQTVSPSSSKETKEGSSTSFKSEENRAQPKAVALESAKTELALPRVNNDDTSSTKEAAKPIADAVANGASGKANSAPSTTNPAKVEQSSDKSVEVEDAEDNVKKDNAPSAEKGSSASAVSSELKGTDSSAKVEDVKPVVPKTESTLSSPKNEGGQPTARSEGAVSPAKTESSSSVSNTQDAKQSTNVGDSISSITPSLNGKDGKTAELKDPSTSLIEEKPVSRNEAATTVKKEEKAPEEKKASALSSSSISSTTTIQPSSKGPDSSPSSASDGAKASVTQKEEGTISTPNPTKSDSASKQSDTATDVKADSDALSVAAQNDAVVGSRSEPPAPSFFAQSNFRQDTDKQQRLRAVIAAMEKANFVGNSLKDESWHSSSVNYFSKHFSHDLNHRYSTNWITDVVTTALMPSEVDLGDVVEASVHAENAGSIANSQSDYQVIEEIDAINDNSAPEATRLTMEEDNEVKQNGNIIEEENFSALNKERSESWTRSHDGIEPGSERDSASKFEPSSSAADTNVNVDVLIPRHRESYAFVPDAVSPNFGVVSASKDKSSGDESVDEFKEEKEIDEQVDGSKSPGGFHDNNEILVVKKGENDNGKDQTKVDDVHLSDTEEVALSKVDDSIEGARTTSDYLASNKADVVNSLPDKLLENDIPVPVSENAAADTGAEAVAARDSSDVLSAEADVPAIHEQSNSIEGDFLPSEPQNELGTVLAVKPNEPLSIAPEQQDVPESISEVQTREESTALLSESLDQEQSLDDILPPSREILSVPEVAEAISTINDHVTAALDVSVRESASGSHQISNVDQHAAVIVKSLVEEAEKQLPATDYNIESASSALSVAQSAIHSVPDPVNELIVSQIDAHHQSTSNEV